MNTLLSVLGFISSILSFAEWFIPKDKLSIRKKLFIFLVLVAVALLLFWQAGLLSNINLSPTQTPIPEQTSGTIASIKNTNLSVEKEDSVVNSFIPDFSPGKENNIGNVPYSNNAGLLCEQDGIYYVATINGILKTDSVFEDFELITKDSASNLNVNGKWIYYCADGGIFRIRSDGAEKELLVAADCGMWNMLVQNDILYYIREDDSKLYKECILNGEATCLSDDTIYNFTIVDCYIYYIKAKFEKTGGTTSISTVSLNRMYTDGTNLQELLINEYKKSGAIVVEVPSDIGVYNNQLVYLNYFGLFTMDYASSEITRLNRIGGYGLCIIGDYAYYSMNEPGTTGVLYRFNMETQEGKRLGQLFDDSYQIHLIYALSDKVVLTLDKDTWYAVNTDGSNMRTLDMTIDIY